jgi:hypothetical protein
VTVEGLLDGDSLTTIGFNYANTDNTTDDGRINAGTAIVTPKDASISGKGDNPDYYKIRYISGSMEVTPINVTVRIEPDRWTGATYTGKDYLTGFTNPNKDIEDYVLISHEGYADLYLNSIWDIITNLNNVTYDSEAAGLGYYVLAEKDVDDYTYNLTLTSADMPDGDGNYSVSLYVRPGRLQILPVELTVTTGSAKKAYDGTPLTCNEASLDGLVEADKEKVTVETTGSQTLVGFSNNTYQVA